MFKGTGNLQGKRQTPFLKGKRSIQPMRPRLPRPRAASGKEAALPWRPEDGQKEAACLSRQEVLRVHVKDQRQVAFWNQRGARLCLEKRTVCGREREGGAYPGSGGGGPPTPSLRGWVPVQGPPTEGCSLAHVHLAHCVAGPYV